MTMLTSTEKQRLIQAERERRRIIRLQQVRAQSSEAAAKIRRRVVKKKEQEIQQIRIELTEAIRERTPQLLRRPRRASQSTSNQSRTTTSTHVCKKRKRSLSARDCEVAAKRGNEALSLEKALKRSTTMRHAEVISRKERAQQMGNLLSRRASPSFGHSDTL